MNGRYRPAEKPSSILGRPPRLITRRAFALFALCTFLAAVILGRLFFLQVIRHEEYKRLVLEQMVYETKITARRGKITDRNGVTLAANYTTERVFIDPHAMKNDEERRLVANGLSEILGVDADKVYEEAQKKKYRDRTIAKNVEKKTADLVRRFILDNDLSSVHLVETPTRYYPYGTLASHVIGFCGADGGLYGLEYQYNEALSGISGKILAAKNGRGGAMPYNYETYIDATNGANLVSTIDYKIQSFLEKYVEEAAIEANCRSRACGIVMDPRNGEILGMATYPPYDLNAPRTIPSYYDDTLRAYADEYGEDSDKYASLRSDLMFAVWNNKCLTETYEPGSTSKIFTVSMTLEEKLAAVTERFTCTGAYTVKGWGRPIRCHKVAGHGTLTLAGGLQQSCNPVMMKLSERIGVSLFCKYFSAFGLDSKTGIDLPGEAGSIFTPESKMTNVDLAVYAFGQRYNVTALQQITAVSAVANGGTLVTPHVVKELRDDDGNVLVSFGKNEVRQVVSRETATTVSEILAEGVAGIGGAKNAAVAGYSVAAKTGTSEKGTGTNKRICSTVAYAPANDPQVAVILIVDEPTIGPIYGSTIAAPFVSKILADTLPYLGIEPTYTPEELAAMELDLPNYRGMSLDEATADLRSRKLTFEVIGEGTTVTRQVPPSGSQLQKNGGRVILYTGEPADSNDIPVPNVVGKTAAEVNKTLTDAGFNLHIVGNSSATTAIRQEPAAGETVPRGTLITVEFRHLGADD